MPENADVRFNQVGMQDGYRQEHGFVHARRGPGATGPNVTGPRNVIADTRVLGSLRRSSHE